MGFRARQSRKNLIQTWRTEAAVQGICADLTRWSSPHMRMRLSFKSDPIRWNPFVRVTDLPCDGLRWIRSN